MKENYQLELAFPSFHGKKITDDFEGSDVSSDAGLALLREVERRVGIIGRLSRCIEDKRDPRYIDHTIGEPMTQRMMQIACVYECADKSDALRYDTIPRSNTATHAEQQN
ncbi:MAG: transposase [Chitinispirillaceae bacterium]|nr:transposase [Chitinispirillaceae bacterium]